MPLLDTPPPTPPATPPARPAALRSRYRFLRQFGRLAGAYWQSEHRWKVRGLTLALLLLTLAQVGLAIWTNYWNRALFDALEDRSLTRFLLQIGTFVVIFVLTMLVTAVHLHVKRWLQIGWRQWLTDRMLDQWMAQGRHYQLQFTGGEHDNPDGRIAEDIHVVTETAIALAHTLVYSVLILGSFIDILLSVSGSASVPGTSVSVPGYMVLLAFVYAGVGTALGLLLGRPLVKATNRLQTLEANFRFALARSREHSEAIALMQGEGVERQRSSRQFDDLRLGWNRQTLAYMGIVSFSSGYGALLPVFPILVAAPQYIAGAMTLGVLMQSAQAFQKLTSALSWPIDNLGDMARCRASADRVLSLHDDLLALEAEAARGDGHRIQHHEAARSELVLHELRIANPDGQLLLDTFSATVHRGERVLVTGDATAAIALFKAVAGLWPWGSGEIRLPRGQAVACMPQRPFLPQGTLRAVLAYPAAADAFTTQHMLHALECAGLSWLAPRLGETEPWERALPLRAQQRIGFARLFLHRPSWVFIEEASDALDPKGEECMMDMLHRELPNATLITIGFHAALRRHHTRSIELVRADSGKYLFRTSAVCLLEDRPLSP